ncbi:MAG: polymer-forming cytoskeletal protein [Acidobacteria bacterium]|nr:polymer-forming cytoskeletal protein [Acidobacteriota bacterium]
MWGKKDITPPPAPPEPQAPPPVNLPQEAKPVATTLMVKPSEPDRPQVRPGQAHIGKSVLVKGEIAASEDLYVDGEVRGAIDLRDYSLTVGPNGKVEANVTAREIVVYGSLNGNVAASEKIEIRKTGSILGDLSTARIIIEDGAYFKGSIDIMKPGQKQEAAKPISSVTKPGPQHTFQMAESGKG